MNKLTILIVTVLILAAGIGGYFIFQKPAFPQPVQQPTPKGCPEDAKVCPDGTVVGRVPPDCEFEPCPAISPEQPIGKTICEPEKEYKHIQVEPIRCTCPEGYEFKVVEMGWGPCGIPGKTDCPASIMKCVKK